MNNIIYITLKNICNRTRRSTDNGKKIFYENRKKLCGKITSVLHGLFMTLNSGKSILKSTAD